MRYHFTGWVAFFATARYVCMYGTPTTHNLPTKNSPRNNHTPALMKQQSCPFSTDKWIQLALSEYEQIASLSNIQSLLGNAAASMSSLPVSRSTDGCASNQNTYDPQDLAFQMQRRNAHDLLSSYSERIDEVRNTHALLKSKSSSITNNNNPNQTKSRPSSLELALADHIELSERVIRTIMRAPQPGSDGPCGLFYENGIIRNANAYDHENNVVALAALRASVSRLRRNFGGCEG